MSPANTVFLTANVVGTEPRLLWEVVRVFGVLIVLLPLVYLCTRLYASRVRGTSTQVIQIIDRVVLGSQGSLVLVRVGKRVFFLCIADKHVVKLGEWEDDGSLVLPEKTEEAPNFVTILRQTLQKREQGANRDEDEQ